MLSSEKKKLLDILLALLAQPSPTFGEKQIFDDLRGILRDFGDYIIHDDPAGMIFSFFVDDSEQKKHQHIAFLGHVDVVPQHFAPFVRAGKVYGAGASDMKSGLAAFVYLLLYYFAPKKKKNIQKTSKKSPKSKNSRQNGRQFSFIFYAAEEMTSLEENGLYALIKKKKNFFQSIDFAIVGEPTDRSLQLGAVGSAHAKVLFRGKSCHSARPWQGENALYKAQKFIQSISRIQPKKQKVFDLDFFDTINITESSCEKGSTTIPGWWQCNINFRFAPTYTVAAAKQKFLQMLTMAGAERKNIDIYSTAYAGTVVDSSFFRQMLKKLQNGRKNLKIEPKQAWTDVAQLGKLKIPCCNYGPGLSAQCHKPQEYTLLKDLVDYTQHLQIWLDDV